MLIVYFSMPLIHPKWVLEDSYTTNLLHSWIWYKITKCGEAYSKLNLQSKLCQIKAHIVCFSTSETLIVNTRCSHFRLPFSITVTLASERYFYSTEKEKQSSTFPFKIKESKTNSRQLSSVKNLLCFIKENKIWPKMYTDHYWFYTVIITIL